MSSLGFGKESGPQTKPGVTTSVQFPPHPSAITFPRGPEAVESMQSSALSFQNSRPSGRSYQSAGIQRRLDTVERMPSPPLAFQNSRPLVKPFQSAGVQRGHEAVERALSPPLGPYSNPGTRPYLPVGVERPVQFPSRWDDGQRSFSKDYDTQSHRRPSAVASFVVSRNSGTTDTTKVARFQDLKRTRSPPSLSIDEVVIRNPNQTVLQSGNSGFKNDGTFVASAARSVALTFKDSSPIQDSHLPFSEARRSPIYFEQNNPPKFPIGCPNLSTQQNMFSVPSYTDSNTSGRSLRHEVVDLQAPKRTRSPPVLSTNEVFLENEKFAQKNSKRPSISPPRFNTKSNDTLTNSGSQIPLRSLPSASIVFATTRVDNGSVPKRTRSPPLLSDEEGFQRNSASSQDDTEREMQAKAKRLVRFKGELSETAATTLTDTINRKVSAKGLEQSIIGRNKFAGEHSMDSAKDIGNDNALSDYEGCEKSSVIIGLCPDMCPESERAERERKGDLDQYERLDGDRNQTSKYLAVKKYSRTAEREANLIRPMPILQKTIDYLLNVLDQPYDDRFLGMYNFLWDRMRAIRMDLRMQHIFNQGAIIMLEQMIRFHIIAMHQLCEFTKGEGFSEGFDAHLNIEQMNKTSVELFQMYDDHRKKGINVPSEKEFRGYYALLKLDRHPGYKVEPAELSLDLAKMTPEIRQTPEVLFARDVARACRTMNFIGFFRLARKASYLQACLMHAHFAKLRTQALASLHSGLQNNQGVPVAHVAKWLGMEEEDIESLLEYHGFLIKEFEEPYMVKDGPFLNVDKDYPTKCSVLVHSKKSRTIVEDVSCSSPIVALPTEATKEIQLSAIWKNDSEVIPSDEKESLFQEVDEEMPDFEILSSPKKGALMQPLIEKSIIDRRSQDYHQLADTSVSPRGFSLVHSSPQYRAVEVGSMEKSNNDVHVSSLPEQNILSGAGAMQWQFLPRTSLEQSSPRAIPLQTVLRTSFLGSSPSGKYDYAVENSVPQSVDLEDEEPSNIHQENENENGKVMRNQEDEKVLEAKLKLIVRLWRRWSSRQRVIREQRQLAGSAALNSLSLGPPIRLITDQPSILGELDIDHVVRERYGKHERSWSRLNVSDVTADILIRRNPDAKCLCWKVILCSQMNNSMDKRMSGTQVSDLAASRWLLSKLVPSRKDDENGDLVVSSPGVSIWKKWVAYQSPDDLVCCLSVVKDSDFGHVKETVSGASAVLFLVSQSTPWSTQKIQLNNLLMSIPSGSCLPLLIVSGLCREEVMDPTSTIVDGLGLHDIDKSRVGSFLVVSLVENMQMQHADGFFSDKRLREGLEWLASESPLQPAVTCVKVRELVLTHLSLSLEVLEKMKSSEVGPNHCIMAFNEALGCTQENIVDAAKLNPVNWPCPEVKLVEDSRDEHLMVNWHLPSVGWSYAERIEPLNRALENCKLPIFQGDLPWLARGCPTGEEIDKQRSQLENSLIRYLTQSSEMMQAPLATKEARVMLQRSTRLELHNISYYIVPEWVMIFRRIFNWRLMSLSSGDFSSAYVLDSCLADSASSDLSKLELNNGIYSSYSSSHPSLDEVIEVGCSPLKSISNPRYPEPSIGPSLTSNQDFQEVFHRGNTTEDRINFLKDHNLAVENNIVCVNSELNRRNGKIVVNGEVSKEAENLSKLLEKCNILQNSISEKLSIYF